MKFICKLKKQVTGNAWQQGLFQRSYRIHTSQCFAAIWQSRLTNQTAIRQFELANFVQC